MLAFISCSKDDEDDNLWLNQGTFDIDGFMFDGGNLDSICFYCTEKDDNSYNTSVKTFKSYTDISFKTFGIDGKKMILLKSLRLHGGHKYKIHISVKELPLFWKSFINGLIFGLSIEQHTLMAR